ncbi:carbon-nitrogen hydrolase family protein [Macrococcoides bohemicum]|uniref:carbon-nitrogen hydrolase family protein n=1 Tax=Macrococcoides bohemicum TaxID=1903056 RepID=UPI000BB57F19|nr:carbon-nitrogen hydrolase family protein [Macrococcus sp. IME1552]ATD31583.1 hypothetical protein BHM04_10435 [Macrococcus sp. IME1552]
MKILIAQPKQEQEISQLKDAVIHHPEVDVFLFPEGYISNIDKLLDVQKLAHDSNKIIISSYRENNKDVAVVIDKGGNIIYSRDKTGSLPNEKLVQPLHFELGDYNAGYILCMEILKGVRDFKTDEQLDVIFHPIGVGMFSEEQLNEWIEAAQKLAIKTKCKVIGTSHADGSYRNCGVSIPIAYMIDQYGKVLLLSKNDIEPKVVEI